MRTCHPVPDRRMLFPLRQLEVTNFRGVQGAVVDLHPRVTVFFGENAAGKTTILDALAIALGAYVRRIPKSRGRDFAKSGDVRVPWKDRFLEQERAGVEAPYSRLGVVSHGGIAWDVTKYRSPQDRRGAPGPTGTRQLNEWLDPRVRAALDTPPGHPTPAIPLVASYGNERAVVEVPLRQRAFRKGFHRLEGLDQALTATTRFKAVFEWFYLMEDQERRSKEAHKDFNYRLPSLEWVRRAVAAAELGCSNPRIETRPIRMLVDFDHGSEGKEPLDLKSLSDGYRTHFSLVVDIARRMVQLNPSDDLNDPQRGTNTPAVVLIDEIDLHLDPKWQGRVVRGLLQAFPNTQFVLSTHSEQVIASVETECVRRLSWEDGAIVVRPVPFAQGATGERVLIDLMGAPERVDGPVRQRLSAYLKLVHGGHGTTPQAQSLRSALDRELPNDPALLGADLEMQRQDLMGRLSALHKGDS